MRRVLISIIQKARLVLDEYIDSLLEVERKADSYERAPCISGIDWKELTMLLKTVQGYSKGLLTPLDPTFACGHIVELSRTVQKPLKRAMAKPPDTYTECDPEDWDDKYSADDYINGSFDEQ